MFTVYIFNLFLPKIPEKVSHAIERHFYLERLLNGETEEMYEFESTSPMSNAPPYNPEYDYDPGYTDMDLESTHSPV